MYIFFVYSVQHIGSAVYKLWPHEGEVREVIDLLGIYTIAVTAGRVQCFAVVAVRPTYTHNKKNGEEQMAQKCMTFYDAPGRCFEHARPIGSSAMRYIVHMAGERRTYGVYL